MNLSRFLMIVLYNVVGALTGFLWQKEHAERNRYQEAAKQLEVSLRQLQEKTEKLTDIENQLLSSERLATLGELTANLAHEVRNPLGSIRGVADILRDESKDKINQKFVDILLKEVQRLDQVVTNYLSYARPQSRTKELKAIRPIVDSVLALVGPELRRRQIRTHIQIQPPEVQLYCDEIQLRQAILNVILNAVAACKDGGEITTKIKRNDNGSVHIAISDNGHGLSESAVKHLFEPFFTTKPNGTGLGLAITKRIVEGHSGLISATGNESGGTTIIMEFPNKDEITKS